MESDFDSNCHQFCYAKPKKRGGPWRQAKLSWTGQGLGIHVPPEPPPRRSPVPNAVKRMRHEPFFSTSEKSLTCLLRLPYDVRLPILLYLLRCSGVRYQLCIATNRILMIDHTAQRYPYVRHGMFPSILQTCSVLHEEGARILYGENSFKLSECAMRHKDGWYQVLNSWPAPEQHTRLATGLGMTFWRGPFEELSAPILMEPFVRFPALRHVCIEFNGSLAKWEEFMASYADVLGAISKVDLTIYCEGRELIETWRRQESMRRPGSDPDGPWAGDLVGEAVLGLYKPPLESRSEQLNKRLVEWTFEDLTDEYGVAAKLSVRLR